MPRASPGNATRGICLVKRGNASRGGVASQKGGTWFLREARRTSALRPLVPAELAELRRHSWLRRLGALTLIWVDCSSALIDMLFEQAGFDANHPTKVASLPYGGVNHRRSSPS